MLLIHLVNQLRLLLQLSLFYQLLLLLLLDQSRLLLQLNQCFLLDQYFLLDQLRLLRLLELLPGRWRQLHQLYLRLLRRSHLCYQQGR
jgi:hypothetical protein